MRLPSLRRFANCCLLAVLGWPASSFAAAVPVKLRQTSAGWELLRDNKPYFVKGAGGDASRELLVQCGGNSVRTWGSDNQDAPLVEANRLGLTMTIGIWLGHKQHGFDYHKADSVREQFEKARAAVMKYKDQPALLLWGVGNEMEIGQPDGDDAVWRAVEEIAAMIKKLDPHHPVMTVVAEVGGDKVKKLHQLCPSVDIVGINTYAGGSSIGKRYREAGGTKPYIVTEFGPPGVWEIPKGKWGTVAELTSTEKVKSYRATYADGVLAEKSQCLGSYAFAWGSKQEATATWYGLLLPDGAKLEAVDLLTEFWSGKPPANRCPRIESLKFTGPDEVKAGEVTRVAVQTSDPEKNAVKVTWALFADPLQYDFGGDTQPTPPSFPDAIQKAGNDSVEIKAPAQGGVYRLYCYVHDGRGGAAVANIPLMVQGPKSAGLAAATALPLTVYDDDGQRAPYIPSGWMGNLKAMQLDGKCTEQPHHGATCIKVQYTAADNWAGVVWQSPANDWGEQPGGYDLSGATQLTFAARGANGGEKVKFGYGVIGRDKKFFDTSQGSTEVFLTKEWKTYTIQLAGRDLTRIKSGFFFSFHAVGQPLTFYIDQIRYEGANGATTAAPATLPASALPVVVYADGLNGLPYVPSGWMGNVGAMAFELKSTTQPHSGETCGQFTYKANDGWGGIVWQSPANDWGEQPGGLNLTGAKKLTFWARGASGGEKVKFLFGVIDRDKPFYDSAKGDTEVTLTEQWQQFAIDLKGRDLTRVKTGFGWSLASPGKPVSFYLDDVQYE